MRQTDWYRVSQSIYRRVDGLEIYLLDRESDRPPRWYGPLSYRWQAGVMAYAATPESMMAILDGAFPEPINGQK